jgi:hypothetical protein
VNRGGDLSTKRFQDRPTIRRQFDERKTTSREILLITQVLVGEDEYVKVGFGAGDQFAIFYSGPTELLNRGDLIVRKKADEAGTAHFHRTEFSRRWPSYEFEKLFSVLVANRGKEGDEFLNGEAIVQVIQEGLHGNSRAVKHDHASYDVRMR